MGAPISRGGPQNVKFWGPGGFKMGGGGGYFHMTPAVPLPPALQGDLRTAKNQQLAAAI